MSEHSQTLSQRFFPFSQRYNCRVLKNHLTMPQKYHTEREISPNLIFVYLSFHFSDRRLILTEFHHGALLQL